MKHLIFIILFTIPVICTLSAQITQFGYVKTKGRLDDNGKVIPGKRLAGVAIVLTNGHSTVSDANGNFTLTIPDKKFYLRYVQKKGYNILDPEMLGKQYFYSVNPLVITMETPSQQLKDQIETQRKIKGILSNNIHKREKELDSLRNANRLTEEEYYAQMQLLYDDRANERLIKEMSQKYAEIDYDLIDTFQQQLCIYILNGKLEEAESMLDACGNILVDIAMLDNVQNANRQEAATLDTMRQNLEASLAYVHWREGNLAQLSIDKASLFTKLQQWDSAAYYLCVLAEIDTNNMDWQLEAGRFLLEQMNAPEKALLYYRRALSYLEPLYGSDHPQVEGIAKEIERILSLLKDK